MNSNRSDILCIGVDGALYDVAWVKDEGWKEKVDLAGTFADIVSVQKVSPHEVDVIGLKPDGTARYTWLPSGGRWGYKGGYFISVPALASWEIDERFDIFGIGFDGRLYHKSYDVRRGSGSRGWAPAQYDWEILG